MRSDDRINAGFLSENEKSEQKEGISVWIRGNFFIPDARKFWIKPSVRFLRKYLRENPVDAIISTGPPHSMHLIALKVKKEFNIPWIADFRDPWTEIDFYDQLRLTRRSDLKHKSQEKEVLHGADRVVVIGKTMAERFASTHTINPVVIPNGFDEADFLNQSASSSEKLPYTDGKFSIIHVGAMNRDRNHPAFWEAISELVEEQPEHMSNLVIKLVGKLDVSVHQTIARHGLQDRVEIDAYLPHHQIIPLLQSASVLYLPINNTPNAKSIQTGKIFEYLASGQPILGTGPEDGDAAEILKECQAGKMVDFNDKIGIKSILTEWAESEKKGMLISKHAGMDKYSRRNLTSSFSELLEEVTRDRNDP